MINYIPIDYNEWILGDDAREGANLKRLGLLNDKELEIWNEAIPYQDRREDPGQAELVTYFALELLKHLPGERKIIVPSAILHDIGWYYGDAREWIRTVKSGTNVETEELRRPHQNRGIMLAGRILERVRYDGKYNMEIADIIGDHDTRKLLANGNGKIVRDADLMWRVTYPCMQIYFSDADSAIAVKKMNKSCLGLTGNLGLGEIGREIAKIESENTLRFKFG